MAAVALADGEMWLEQTDDERRADADVSGFAADLVTVAEDATLPATGARVTLRAPDGSKRVHQVDVPLGDPQRPLSAQDVREKLVRATSTLGMTDRFEALVAAVASLESAASVQALISAVREDQ
jgi:2-methylcitrate dehydratase PrpD